MLFNVVLSYCTDGHVIAGIRET